MRAGLTAAACGLALLAAAPGPAAARALPPSAQPPAADPREIGVMIDQANGLAARDPVRARALMAKAADSGNADALNGLAVFTRLGVGAKPDEKAARVLFEQAVRGGSNAARLNLGAILVDEPDEGSRSRGFAMLQTAYDDEQLRGAAAYPLGRAVLLGRGTPQNTAQGAGLLRQAEAAGGREPDLLYLLGRAAESGWGAPRNSALAVAYFRKAAEAGDGRAQWRLGMHLLEGNGVAADTAEAYGWVRKAAEAGDLQGQISLAAMLATGQGTAENDAEARVWYARAAERNSAHALRGLGAMLLTGEGGPADGVRGVAFLELARDGGDALAGQVLKQLLPTPPDAAARARIDALKTSWKKAHGQPS